MSMLTVAISQTDQADLVILANVETIRDQVQPATANAVAALIGGAPPREVQPRLAKLSLLGCLERVTGTYQLSELGAELLRQELVGWTPSKREDRRREFELRARLQERAS